MTEKLFFSHICLVIYVYDRPGRVMNGGKGRKVFFLHMARPSRTTKKKRFFHKKEKNKLYGVPTLEVEPLKKLCFCSKGDRKIF